MNIFKKIAKKVGSSLLDFAYNEDRAVASLAGAPKDFTISGESAKHKVLAPLADTLDAVHFAGDPHHAQDALIHDTVLQTADNQISAVEKADGQH
jgi:hypothetical protein